MKNGWTEDRVHYLPNFVSGGTVPALPRQTFFTPDRTPLILALGRLHENKAFDVLFQAVARVPLGVAAGASLVIGLLTLLLLVPLQVLWWQLIGVLP